MDITSGVIKVGDGGRGFIVRTAGDERLILTARHCLDEIPSPLNTKITDRLVHAAAGPLDGPLTVALRPVFADSVGDLAVFAAPTMRDHEAEAEAYNDFIAGRHCFDIAAPSPHCARARALDLAGHWVDVAIEDVSGWLHLRPSVLVPGMSGGPIIDSAGRAIAICSNTASSQPIIVERLPSFLARQLHADLRRAA